MSGKPRPPHLDEAPTVTIGENLNADDRYWAGRDGNYDVDRAVAHAYASKLVLTQILLPVITSHPASKGPKLEGRMDAALQALLAIEPERGRSVALADEKILFRVGQEFHRRWDRLKPKEPLIGALCREAVREVDGFFDSKEAVFQKKEIDRLKRKFKLKPDFYCSVGSALADYDYRRREIIASQIVGLLGELGLVKGDK